MGCNSSSIPPNCTHTAYVKTGDKKGAGTDGNIYLTLEDAEGNMSAENYIDTLWKDDFERGNTDIFHLECPHLKKITEIQIRRDDEKPNELWYLEKVAIENRVSQSESVFPVHRWIGASQSLKISEFDSVLPQDDKNPEQRSAELEKKKEKYRLAGEDGLPKYIEEFPEEELFSNEYKMDIIKQKIELLAKTKYVNLTTSKFKTLKDFETIWRRDILPKPYGIDNWQSDVEFGNQRLAGCNTTSLELCREIPEHVPVTAELLEPFLEDQKLEDCIEKKKIYIIDFRYLRDIECTAGRKLPGPTCIFYVNKRSELVPIAIQLQPEPADDNPIFLPNDGYVWLIAKMWFNLADASHHQSVAHIGFTHKIMEAFTVCTYRQLSQSHPIFRLLAPHFLYVIAINSIGLAKVVGEDGIFDKVMQIGRTGMFNIVRVNWKKWNLQEYGNLKGDLKRRGVDDTEALPNYHYRDDALLLWDAMEKYVRYVVTAYYDDPSKIERDTELQSWAAELHSEAECEGIPEKITTAEEIVEIVTCFIFIPSVGHAAANFTVYDEYGFPPNYPGLLIGEPPKTKDAMSEEDVVKALPDKEMVLRQLVLHKISSTKITNELGNFEVQYAYGPKSIEALKQFRADLVKAGETIDSRNTTRARKYPYLHPKEVSNSISN